MPASLPFQAFKRPELATYPDLQVWSEHLRQHSQPADPIEQALVDRIVRIAYRLRHAETKLDDSPADKDAIRLVTEAERAWTRALSDWTRYRKARKSLKPTPRPKPESESQPSTSQPEPEPYIPPSEPVSWPDHVALDPSVSPTRLVIKGTNILVELVAAMLEEGWSPQEIHHDFPTLNGTHIEAARLCDTAGQSSIPPDSPTPPDPHPQPLPCLA